MAWTPSETERRKHVEAGGTVVANLKEDLRLVAWAQKTGCLVRICRPTRWGNPFVIGPDGERRDVLKQYRKYINQKRSLLSQIDKLKGKVLGCWCFPENCHGDELIRLIGAPDEHSPH